MSILYFLIMGLIVGALARLIKPGKQNLGIIGTIVLGVLGAVIGGLLASLIGTGEIGDMDFLGFIFALVAAVLLIGVVEGVLGKNKTKSRV
ncbi:GlsB/YeaQ/YmgE family stress response membrane protein [Nocardioides sp. AX2bis]|uniref:GlsB/YeaQ/YmgE family stress response membrane protein n=1 Tax=Nocardioides sp. AX2bis TaxID=2653157 RepID=UPI0012EEFFF8|nr:GlsB/YeaQ/YmgE family stress response membrane protein [Nocardioides sp. AX2bis]VXC05243.1 conserved membrane hypothetical protein [Nocardioides sp. AX2bis]